MAVRTSDAFGPEPLVLCYHDVSGQRPFAWCITPRQLREQLELLVARRYLGRTFHDAVTQSSAMAITFDDAFRSVLDVAHPILSSLGLVATVFVVTDFADAKRPFEWLDGGPSSDLHSLSWGELAQLADEGWEIGSHTRTHRQLTQLDDDELEQELRGSREACEDALGRPCRSLAYPFGAFDQRVITAAADAGYEAAATLPSALVEPRPLAWPRIGVYHKDSLTRFRIKISPTIVRLRRAVAPVELAVRRNEP